MIIMYVLRTCRAGPLKEGFRVCRKTNWVMGSCEGVLDEKG